MAPPPRNRLSGDMAPDSPGWWKERVLPALQAMLADVTAGLDKGLTRRENSAGDGDDVDFTTGTPAHSTVVRVKHRMKTTPRDVWCSQLRRKDGAELDTPWSMTWLVGGEGQLELKFQGLDDDTRHLARILYE